MRRQDRERDAAFAWAVFDTAPYAALSLRDGEGGYGVIVSPARIGERVYFHCAPEGHKLDCIARWPQGTLTAVSRSGPARFSVAYASAALRGTLSVVTDREEKRAALRAITIRYCPADLPGFDAYADAAMDKTAVYRMDVSEITGKERPEV